MNLLAIDTSFSICSVAILADGKTYSSYISEVKQSGQVLDLINQLLTSAKLTLSQLNAIAVGCGPGSFTGIRVAVSVAQGLGYALSLPVVPVSSLAILAQAAFELHGWQKIITAVDARMNEVYWAAWQSLSGSLQLIDNESISLPETFILPDQTGWYGMGDAWATYAEKLPQPISIDTKKYPLAPYLLSLAVNLFNQGKFISAELLQPNYLRDMLYQKSSLIK